MKKQSGLQFITLFLTGTVFALTLLLGSCSNGFLKDPRLYNPKKVNKQVIADDGELELTGGVDPFDDLTKWYNNPNCNGDTDDNPTGPIEFSPLEFDTMGITGAFDNRNVPTYSIQNGTVTWSISNEGKREYRWKGPDTEGQGYPIGNVNYYQYRGINPSYAADGDYNSKLQETVNRNPKLNRFYFYRFTGKGGGIADLDNYLFAVDTYSKFLFAFSEPVKFSSMGAPTQWSPTDGGEYTDGTRYMFYEYDPVGYITKDISGKYTVQLYGWFTASLANKDYKSKMGTGGTDMARKTPDGAGKSPFNAHNKDYFGTNMTLWSKTVFINRPSETDPDGTFHENGSWMYKYVFDGTDNTITEQKEQYGKIESQQGRVFEYVSASSASEATFTDKDGNEWNFSIADNGSSFTLIHGEEKITATAGNDPGPSWLIRVRGKTFDGSGYTYEFSSDGKSIGLSNGKTYTYAQQDANNRAVYRQQAAVYWGVKIVDNDTSIFWTPTSWASPSTTPSSLANEWQAWITVEKAGNFGDNVKNAIFSYREADGYTGNDGKGYGLNLESIKFSADGKEAYRETTPWRGNTTRKEIYRMDEETTPTDLEATFVNNNDSSQKIEFILDGSIQAITVDGVKYYRNFPDPGPSFINRVKAGAEFSGDGGNIQYKFTNEGKDLFVQWPGWFSNLSSNYTFHRKYDDVNRSRALYYGEAKSPIGTGAGWWYYGLELTETDNVIRMTSGGADGGLLWEATLNYEARRIK